MLKEKDIAHVAIQGTSDPHDMLPGTEGDSDNQKVPPSSSSTYIQHIKKDFSHQMILSVQIFYREKEKFCKLSFDTFSLS